MDKQCLHILEERLLHAISSISDHIYVGDLTQTGNPSSHYFSPHIESLTGYPTENFLTDWRFWQSLIYPDDRSTALIKPEHLVKGGASEMEYRLVRAGGDIVWVRDSRQIEVERDRTSHIKRVMVYGVVSDITKRKQAEAEVQRLTENLEQRVANRTRELSALYEIAALASESRNLQKILNHCIQQVMTVTKSSMGAIHIVSDLEDGLQLANHRNLPPDILPQIDFFPADRGLAGMVIAHDVPFLIPDLASEPELARFAPSASPSPYLGVPMRARGRVVGLLSIFGETGQQFNMAEAALLSSIAGHVGVAIENDQLSRQAEQLAILEERERLARELHDSVTQSLYSLNLFAEVGWETAELGDLEAVKDNFTRMGEAALHALKEMRLLVHELRPLDLAHTGLAGALQQRLYAVEKRAKVKTNLLVETLVDLPPPIEESLYRIAQEALNNALKHAAATSVTVCLRPDGDHIELAVEDNGRGFYPDATNGMGGMGLTNMKRRAERLGGSLTISSEINRGTTIKVRVRAKVS